MKNTPGHEPADRSGGRLPTPRRGAPWRWSTPPKALVAGGALATVLSLGAVAAAAGATTSSGSRAGPPGRPPTGAARPTLLGRVSALGGADITVETRGQKTTRVTYSSATAFEVTSGPSGTPSSTSASALEVGDFVGVRGTRNGDGSVTASSIVIGTPPPAGAPARGARSARRTVDRFP